MEGFLKKSQIIDLKYKMESSVLIRESSCICRRKDIRQISKYFHSTGTAGLPLSGISYNWQPPGLLVHFTNCWGERLMYTRTM